MEEPLLVVISLTMFVGSYIAGYIPLFFTLSEKRIRIASIFGAGLLVGTAFCVIIPEGISSLAEASYPPNPIVAHKDDSHSSHLTRADVSFEDGNRSSKKRKEQKLHRRNVRNWDINGVVLDQKISKRNSDNTMKVGEGLNLPPDDQERVKGRDEGSSSFEQMNGPIGVSLLVGFLFMHIIDQLSKLSNVRNKGMPTLGLVIHAFADGIAMGSASSAGSQMELQLLVFVAIMLHKAPTAFALISILLANGLDKARVRRHLLIFSLAAPIGTVLTYAFLHTAQSKVPTPTGAYTDSHGETPSQFTGIILLFSAGTFLYIATVHVLPELIESKCSSALGVTGMSGSREILLGGGEKMPSSSASSRFSLAELCLFCASALVPAFVSSTTHGAHGHK